MLELMTGWKSSGVGDPEEERKTNVASLLRPDDWDLRAAYVRSLSRLGACEAIWQDWMELRDLLQDQDSEATPENMVGVYVRALMASGDHDRARKLALDGGTDGDGGNGLWTPLRRGASSPSKVDPERWAWMVEDLFKAGDGAMTVADAMYR
ncbi:MAG: hypothetical protein M1832_002699 [Thelocarpon impressellum]|nr:MAG: hypothetical protein M1832_002699 [Thelocarpon impressellum]